MASFQQHKDGWRASVQRKGVRKSKVLPTKRAAQDWANAVENEILFSGPAGQRVTLAAAFEKYAREVSIRKRGARWEMIRLEKFQTYPIAAKMIGDVTAKDLADWRDARLKDVKGASVRREMQLMSGVFTIARKEWQWISVSPMTDVRKPPSSPRRDRLATESEMKALAVSAGQDMQKATARSFAAFSFAVETGMRAGEIVGLEWSRIDVTRRVVHLPITKNGEARNVPLSTKAIEILKAQSEADPVFSLRSDQLSALWRKLRDRANVEGLTFHDSRHMAITRLAKKFDVLDLARVVGHRDIKMLMTYYEADAEALARLLD